jgi:hypothetical protein
MMGYPIVSSTDVQIQNIVRLMCMDDGKVEQFRGRCKRIEGKKIPAQQIDKSAGPLCAFLQKEGGICF